MFPYVAGGLPCQEGAKWAIVWFLQATWGDGKTHLLRRLSENLRSSGAEVNSDATATDVSRLR